MKKLLILSLFSLIVGCASGPSIKGSYNAPDKNINQSLLSNNKAELRIYRIDAFLQKLVDVRIFINNEESASLSNSSATTITMEPGKHAIFAKMGGLDANSGCGFEFEITNGEVIYMSLSPAASGALPIISILTNPMVCKFNLVPVASKQGEKEFAEIQSSKT